MPIRITMTLKKANFK